MFKLIISIAIFCEILNFAIVVNGKKPNYDLAEMLGKATSHMNAQEHLKTLGAETEILFDLLNYNSFIPTNKTILPPIFEHLRKTASSKCFQDLLYVFKSFPGKDMWSVKMLDSSAKFDSGILNGNTKWLGNYQECVNVYAPPDHSGGNFHGQYCTLEVTVQVGATSMPFTLGICLPDSCDPSSYTKDFNNTRNERKYLFRNLLPKSPLNISLQSCQPREKEFTNAAIGMIMFLSILIFIAVVGSFITVFELYFPKKKPEQRFISEDIENTSVGNLSGKARTHSIAEEVLIKDESRKKSTPAWLSGLDSFLNCFCVFTNGSKLLNTSNTEGQMLCLNGIRFLSMCWVMVCHTYAFATTGNNVNNMVEVAGLVDNLPFQIILNGFFSVDSFFLLSGFLMAYLYFQETEKTNGKVPWLYFYVHRYLRLTPVYMIVLGTYTALFYYMGEGPVYQLNQIDTLCHDNWWYNLLYINNFQSMGKQCIGWSWYLANDMQFFAISPLFLISLRRWPKVGFSILGIFLCATFATNFFITYHFNLVSGFEDLRGITDMAQLMIKWQSFMDKIYIRPYTRIGPYLVGIALGYYLHHRKQNSVGKDRKSIMAVGWLVSTAVVLTCQFSLYHNNMSTVACAFYNATSRVCFGLGLGWVIFACVTGQGGPVNKLLSYKLFTPLSRLTYCAYLIHPVVMYWFFLSLKSTITFSHMNMVFLFFGFLLVTYFFALLTSLLFESPVIRLEKLIRSKVSSSR